MGVKTTRTVRKREGYDELHQKGVYKKEKFDLKYNSPLITVHG